MLNSKGGWWGDDDRPLHCTRCRAHLKSCPPLGDICRQPRHFERQLRSCSRRHLLVATDGNGVALLDQKSPRPHSLRKLNLRIAEQPCSLKLGVRKSQSNAMRSEKWQRDRAVLQNTTDRIHQRQRWRIPACTVEDRHQEKDRVASHPCSQ